MPVSEKTFRQLALEDPSGHWELYCGLLRQKPSMSAEHNRAAMYLAGQLIQQLDRHEFEVRVNMGHVHHTSGSYYIPDVLVIPADVVRPLRGQHVLEAYDRPLPLVVEVWSPSTGDYDVETKLLEYQRRGDQEIWRLHPFDRTLTAWRRQPDGSYLETRLAGGAVRPAALPGVTIDLDALFE
jgi:Uma2 family endonuclease